VSRWLVIAIAVAACTSARDHDCKQVREVADLTTATADPRTRAEALTWQDPEIRELMKASLASQGWTTYTPYDTRHVDAYTRLHELCQLR
jgi:hypothetical protein